MHIKRLVEDFKMLYTKKFCVSFLTSALVLLHGCASLAIDDEALKQRTEMALGIERKGFTISERTDIGLETQYKVTTNSGKVYRCQIGGTVALIGNVVSDANCKDFNTETDYKSSCNALEMASGSCTKH